MNDQSSRSHSVFTLHLTATNAKLDAVVAGQLNLCDLAGGALAGLWAQGLELLGLELLGLELLGLALRPLTIGNPPSLGPERVDRSGVTDTALTEAKNINKSPARSRTCLNR